MSTVQSSGLPLLSFALPIRNGEKLLPELIDSLLAQNYPNFEIVICDNASTDATEEVCQRYVQQDSRIRYFRNPENVGILANFNRLIDLCQGKYMRWIGCDDRLEPDYASKCTAAIASRPDAIGVTTNYDFIDKDGSRDFREYRGRRLDFPKATQRYAKVLWFLTADFRFLDPVYTLVRRDVLQKIGGHRLDVIASDQVLAVEMALAGPFVHVPVYLAHRGKLHFDTSTEQLIERCYASNAHLVIHQTHIDALTAFWEPIQKSSLSRFERVLCLFPFLQCFWTLTWCFVRDSIDKLLHPIKKFIKNLLQLPAKSATYSGS
jgi:glycosyltransferase involved in cell wall biosynthesis